MRGNDYRMPSEVVSDISRLPMDGSEVRLRPKQYADLHAWMTAQGRTPTMRDGLLTIMDHPIVESTQYMKGPRLKKKRA